MKLPKLAGQCETAEEFIFEVRRLDLIDEVYSWERSMPENIERFRHSGWFTVAADFWLEHNVGAL